MRQLSKQYLFPIVLMLAVAIGGYILSKAGFNSVQQMRQLERVPATTINAILPGEVNVTAIAGKNQQTVKSFHTQTPSLYYYYTEEVEEKDSDGDTSWRTVDEKTESVDFIIKDATGSALVRRGSASINWSVPISHQTTSGRHRYTEKRIEPGDQLFIFAMADIEQQEIELSFPETGQYTPIISKFSEEKERGEMGETSVIQIWLGIALLSLSVYFFSYTFRIHRLVAYLSILTVVLSIILIDMGLMMMHDDLVSGEQRYRNQLSAATDRVQGILQQQNIRFDDWSNLHELSNVRYYSLNAQQKQTIEQIRINILMAREQLVRHMQAIPEKWFVSLWSIEMPKPVYAPESTGSKLKKRIDTYSESKLDKSSTTIFSIIGAVIALFTAWYGIRHVKTKRYIENVPTSSTSGVVFGVCEVVGKLVLKQGAEALKSPLTSSECGWYFYHVEEKRGSGKNSKWVTIEKITESIEFFCQDNDGLIRVDADKAEINTIHKTVVIKGDRRHTEKTLCMDDDLYVLGYAGLSEQYPDTLTIQYSSHREPFIISNLSEQEVLLNKARKGIFSLNISFSSVVLVALILFGISGGFAPTDFLMSALISPIFMLIIMLILHYNDIVFLRQRVERNWSNIGVSLKKRINLIPDIKAVVDAYSQHEESLLKDITDFRRQYSRSIKSTETIKAMLKQQNGIKLRLEKLQENYPELKSSQVFEKMMGILSSIENEVMYMRTGYNDAVELYNTRIHSVPDVLFTAVLGFKEKDFIGL